MLDKINQGIICEPVSCALLPPAIANFPLYLKDFSESKWEPCLPCDAIANAEAAGGMTYGAGWPGWDDKYAGICCTEVYNPVRYTYGENGRNAV